MALAAVTGVVIAVGFATTSVAAASAAPPASRPPLPAPLRTEGRPLPEDQVVTRQGIPSTPLTRRASSTTTSPSLLGGDLADAPGDRVVGHLVATGGSDVLPDGPFDTLAWVTDRTATRLEGPDRYDTAVAVSADAFPTGAPVTFIATGQDFPDGLAASATAGVLGGPVLLARQSTIAQGTLDELVRLAPATVHVVGGAAVVSDAVMEAVAAALPGATVDRVFGQDRTATAAALARLLPVQHDVALLATAANFPDALAGGPAAAKLGGPLLLTATASLSPAARTELARIRPARVFIAGGPSVVSARVASEVAAATGGTVERLYGSDRYATASAVSARVFSATSATITLATGTTFPDALGAGAYAAHVGGPLLLMTLDATAPRATTDEARRLSWYRPASGRVIRYIPIVHPDDEMSSRSLLGPPDTTRYDVFILLTTGETTRYCNGKPVSNPWMSSQFLPQPQPTGLPLSDRCKSHRTQTWNTYLSRTGLGAIPTYSRRTGQPITWNGELLPAPVHRNADGVEEPIETFDAWIGPNQARFVFDMGVLQAYEVIWALENVRALRSTFAPDAEEGDVVGAGYHNSTTTGSYYDTADHRLLYTTLGTQDLALPGSQYIPVGHVEEGRAFGATVPSYCLEMCHPADSSGWAGSMGRFQYSYGWLRSGQWPTGSVDAVAGFSQYQSFAKFF